jgi:hypothetical protein
VYRIAKKKLKLKHQVIKRTFSEGETSKMYKKRIICLTLLSALLFLSLFCHVGYSADAVLTLHDLPGVGESLVISSDSVLTVNVDESAVIDGAALQINGTDDALTEVKIINNGELTIKSTAIGCNHANFTIQNTGTIKPQTVHFTVIGNSTLSVDNEGHCLMTDTSFDVYGGYAYFSNTCSLNIQKGYFKDQFDGTSIANYGNAILSECTFVANGAYGKFELFNAGDLKLHHVVFDVNYGGTVNMNTLTGILTATECSVDVSGWSHGKKSQVNILGDIATWDNCSFVNNGGTINYLNTGDLNLSNCSGYNAGVNSSTILSSSGPMVFENFVLSGSGSTSITNWDSMTLIDSVYNCSHALTLMNNGELNAENWLVKTTSSTARIVVYNGNNGSITFDVPFIEDVSSETLASIGSEGQQFVESSGGIITVTNNGSMNAQGSTGASGLEYLLYILIIVVVVAVSLVVILRNRKNLQTQVLRCFVD